MIIKRWKIQTDPEPWQQKKKSSETNLINLETKMSPTDGGVGEENLQKL